MAGLYQMTVSIFLSFLEILFISLKTEMSVWSNSSLFLITNNLCFIRYWYSCKDTCKNKASVSFVLALNEADFHPLSPPVHARKCKLSSFSNNFNLALCETHGSNYVSSTSKPVENLAVLNL